MAADGGDLLDFSARGRVGFAHDFEGAAGYVEEAEEVDLYSRDWKWLVQLLGGLCLS